MIVTEPKVEQRAAVPYMGIRTDATMEQLPTVIPQLIGEMFGWLGQQGIALRRVPAIPAQPLCLAPFQ